MSIDRDKALKAAQKYLAKGQIDRAIGEYERVIAEDPGDARSLLKLGDLYARSGASRQASATYHKVARQYARDGYFLKAVAVYKQILKLSPNDLSSWGQLAEMYEQLSLVSDAVSAYEYVADAHSNSGNERAAIDALAKITELDPDNVPAWVRYAEGLSRTRQIGSAVEAFATAANVLKEQQRIDDYVKVTERLLYHAPDEHDRARELAAVYVERGDAKQALARLQSCFRAEPENPATLTLLASAFRLAGQSGKAASVYRELVRLHQTAGRTRELRQALQGLLEVDPDNADAQQQLANLPEEPGEDDYIEDLVIVDEEEAVERAPSMRPTAPQDDQQESAAEQIARLMSEYQVFLRYGLEERAVAHLRMILELDPDHEVAKNKLAEVSGAPPPAPSALRSVPPAPRQAPEEDDDDVFFITDEVPAPPPEADAATETAEVAAAPSEDDDDEPELILEGESEPPTASSPEPAAAASEADSVVVPDALAEALGEASFYVEQGLIDDAREALEDASAEFPDHPALLAALADFAAREAQTPESSAPPGPPESVPIADVVSKFRQGVAVQIDDEDTDTHYDLGIAYMEMGLHAEAIEEFRLCLDESDQKGAAHTMLGLCHVSRGEMQQGIEQFNLALALPDVPQREQLGLWFEIGNAHELLGKPSEALVWYTKVEEVDAAFRDTTARIERIGRPKTEEQEADEFDVMFDNLIVKE